MVRAFFLSLSLYKTFSLMRYLNIQFMFGFLFSLASLPNIASQTAYSYSEYISQATLIPNPEGYLVKGNGEVRSDVDGRLVSKSLYHIDNTISDPVSIAKAYIESQCNDLGLCNLVDNLFDNIRIDTLRGGFIISFAIRHFNHLLENGAVRIKINRKGAVRYIENYVPPTLTSLDQLKEYSSQLKVLDHLVF